MQLTPMTPDEIDSLIRESHYAHLGCSADGETYVVPITYVAEGDVLCSFTHEGKKMEMMRKYPDVCVQLEKLENDGWQSVVCRGVFEEITEHDEAQRVSLAIAEQFAGVSAKGESMISPLVSTLNHYREEPHTGVSRIRLTTKNGRKDGVLRVTGTPNRPRV